MAERGVNANAKMLIQIDTDCRDKLSLRENELPCPTFLTLTRKFAIVWTQSDTKLGLIDAVCSITVHPRDK